MRLGFHADGIWPDVTVWERHVQSVTHLLNSSGNPRSSVGTSSAGLSSSECLGPGLIQQSNLLQDSVSKKGHNQLWRTTMPALLGVRSGPIVDRRQLKRLAIALTTRERSC